MSITLYQAPMSSATRVHWALEELGLPYTKVRVDLAAGEQKSADFLAINPNGKVPALVVDGTPMFESLAMILYLGETFGVARNLWPAHGTVEYPQALSWAVWSQVTFGAHLWALVVNTSERFPSEGRNAYAAERARKELATDLGILEARLDGRDQLLGNHFTLVDVAAASVAAVITRMNLADVAPFPRTAAWIQRCTARQAMAVALAG